MIVSRQLSIICGLAAWLALAMQPSWAQPKPPAAGAPNALQGFSQNKDQPVQIEATSLEVKDKQGIATFTGNVKVVQGDTTLRCKLLVVYYTGQGQEKQPSVKAAQPGPGGSQQISRLEAKGGVIVTQKDQTATGESAIFEMNSNTITLSGNVVISQGKNIMKGERLVVDMTSGAAKVESSKKGPVSMIIQQTAQPPGAAAAPGAAGQKPAIMRPFSSN